jgi:hypothetical protein
MPGGSRLQQFISAGLSLLGISMDPDVTTATLVGCQCFTAGQSLPGLGKALKLAYS